MRSMRTLSSFCAPLHWLSPTKSDLQQRDIIVIRNPGLKSEIAELMSEQSWIAEIPCLLVFCGNNRRQRRLHQLRNRSV